LSNDLENRIGEAYDAHQAGRLDVAERQYRALLDEAPSQVDVLYLLSSLRVAARPDEALALARRAVEASGGQGGLGVSEPALLDHLAACLARCGDDPALESGVLERARQLDPRNVERLFRLADAQRRAGRIADAMATLERYLAERPADINARTNLGALQVQSGRIAEAVATLRQVLAADPKHVQAATNLGYAYSQMGLVAEAAAQYEAAVAASPNFVEGWINLAGAQYTLDRLDAAEAAYRRALELQPDSELAAAGLNRILVSLVPRWHFVMMNDRRRNEAYDVAIRQAVAGWTSRHGRPPLVLEIGAGSGLLSMMAARAGAEVVACEMVKPVADAAREIIARNGLADRIRLVHNKSTNLRVGVDLPRRADLLISEIFDIGLLGEYVLPVIGHARQELLAPDAIVLPGRASVWMMAIDSTEIREFYYADNANTCGFDVESFNRFAKRDYEQLAIRRFRHRALTPPTKVLDFDFHHDVPDRDLLLRVPVTDGGRLDAWAFWFELDFDGETCFDTGPLGPETCWSQAVQVEAAPPVVSAGAELAVRVRQTQTTIRFSLAEA
jgi:tetratricopeptide (TPR) repeat protein